MERSVNKFRGTLAKLFAEELENMDLNAMLDDDIRELYEFIGVDVPDAEKKLRFERCAGCSLFDTMLTVKGRRESKRAAAKDDEAPVYVLFVYCGSVLKPCSPPVRASRSRKKSKQESDDEEFTSPHNNNLSPMKPSTKR